MESLHHLGVLSGHTVQELLGVFPGKQLVGVAADELGNVGPHDGDGVHHRVAGGAGIFRIAGAHP